MPAEYPEGNDTLLAKEPCPRCRSNGGDLDGDNLARYADGHAHCFACGYREGSEGSSKWSVGKTRMHPAVPDALIEPGAGAFVDLAKRKLDGPTLKKYGYFQATYNKQPVHVAPYYDQAGNLVAQKLRWPNKDFTVLKASSETPPLGQCQLFGRHVYGDRYDKTVIVTEGELDALSVAQVLGFKRPVVSVNTGSQGAAKCLQANYLWLDRFEDIILYFDDDDPGRAAVEECAKLFKVGKVRVAKIAGLKDASDALQAGRGGDIDGAIWGASRWRPRGIVNAAECRADMDGVARSGWAYPWPKLQDMLRGIVPGEVTYHVAGTGVGKSTIINEVELGILKNNPEVKLGHMDFEHSRKEAQLGILSVAASRRLVLSPLPKAEMDALHEEVFGSGRVELFDPETAEWGMDAIMGYIRYMVRALGCQVIVIDPLSFIVAGSVGAASNPVAALDKVSHDLAGTARELGVALQVAHHLARPKDGPAHEEGGEVSIGQVRGSGGLANFSKQILGYERNQQAESPEDRLITRIRVLKNSPVGSTGVADILAYDPETGRYKTTNRPWPEPKKGRGAPRGRGGFGEVPVDQFSEF